MSDQEEYDDYGMDVDQSSQANTIDTVENENDNDDVSGDEGDDSSDGGDSDIDAEVELYEKYAETLKVISSESYGYDNYVELVRLAQ